MSMEDTLLELDKTNPRTNVDLREVFLYHLLKFFLQYTDHISEMFPSLCLDGFWMA